MKKLLIAAVSAALILTACDLNKALDAANKGLDAVNSGTGSGGFTNVQIVQALKDALNQGTNVATASASKMDGFNKNPKIRIPWPRRTG